MVGSSKTKRRISRQTARSRDGQSLVEFALVALVSYLLLAAILTFGHMIYVAQVLQQAADVAAREIARIPLPADYSLEKALEDPAVQQKVFHSRWLFVYLDELSEGQTIPDYVKEHFPPINQLLYPVMIVEELQGRSVLHYPGITSPPDTAMPVFYVESTSGNEREIKQIPVIEEVEVEDESDPRHNPFSLLSSSTGLVALRINYPYRSATMSSYQYVNSAGEYYTRPPLGENDVISVAVEVENPTGEFGPYVGADGLGQQAVAGKVVRPFSRTITAQAIYRREIFLPPRTPSISPVPPIVTPTP